MLKTKCKYERPVMQVVKLREMPQLLAGSTTSTGVNNYDVDTEQTW